MARGKFGFKRPFAVEREFLTIKIVGYDINSATVSSANGHVINGEIHPFFDIDHITHNRSPEGTVDTIIRVDTDNDMVEMKDIRLLAGNLGERVPEPITPGDINIIPSLEVNRRLAEPEQVPKLMSEYVTSRGGLEEFTDSIEESFKESTEMRVIETKRSGGNNIGIVISEGLPLSIPNGMAQDIMGPRNKNATSVSFDVIGIEE